VNLGLRTRLYTRHIISHRIHASLCRVDFNDRCKFILTPLQLFFPVDTQGLAELEHHGLRVRAAV